MLIKLIQSQNGKHALQYIENSLKYEEKCGNNRIGYNSRSINNPFVNNYIFIFKSLRLPRCSGIELFQVLEPHYK